MKTKAVIATTVTVKSLDAFISLPDSLLVSIISLLPTKEAVTTSVLSHRWRYLWTQITHLSFSGPHLPEQPTHDQILEYMSKFDSFLTDVDHVFHHLTSLKVDKFELIIDVPITHYSNRCDSLVYSWLRRVCSRHPEDISVIPLPSSCWEQHLINIPACIFQCDTIVSLNMSRGLVYELDIDHLNINLPNLKKLGMYLHATHEKLLTTLLKFCPLVVELILRTPFYERGHVVEILCPNLKSLNISGHKFTQKATFVIDAPKLEDLSISSYATRYHFIRRLSVLVKADILMMDQWYNDKELHDQMVEVLCDVSNVSFLGIYGGMLWHIGLFKDESLPVFRDLTKLSVRDFDFTRLDDLFLVISCCPNMEVLVLRMVKVDSGVEISMNWAPSFEPACLLTKLRVLELRKLRRIDQRLGFMEYLLRNGSVLEKLLVSVCSNDGDDEHLKEFECCNTLLSCPRSSLACEIHYSSHCIIASSKSFIDGILDGVIRYRDVFETCNCWM